MGDGRNSSKPAKNLARGLKQLSVFGTEGLKKITKKSEAWLDSYDLGQSEKKRVFLIALSRIGIVSSAMAIADISRKRYYDWLLQNDKLAYDMATKVAQKLADDFKAAKEEAMERAEALLETEAKKRALGGSDRLIEFMLKAQNPTKYRDNSKLEVTGGLTLEQMINDSMTKKKKEEDK